MSAELSSTEGEWVSSTPTAETPASDQVPGETYGSITSKTVRTASSQYRTATVTTDSEGEPLPIVIVAGPEDLQELGIDPSQVDSVKYRFVNGRLIACPAE